MGAIVRQSFAAGWVPSADLFNGPKDGLLRMDNLMLDELGAVALRQGSGKLSTTALPGSLDVHSLFTATINGARYRLTGAANGVFLSGHAIAGMPGTGDVAFGAHAGQILFARGTSKKKYDGSTVRPWGITKPNAAPVLTAIAADSKVFASCASAESPAMTSNEGSQAFQPDKAGAANAAVELTPDTTTGRATSTKTFAAATDFTAYNAGQTGTDDDLIDFYNYVTEPQFIDFIQLMIDVNDGTFQEDWYETTFHAGEALEVVADVEDSLESNYDVEGEDRDRVRGDIVRGNSNLAQAQSSPQTSFRNDKPVSNTGWNHFTISRGAMERHGLTSGKNWSTVKAVRVVVQAIAGGSAAAVRFDEIKIVGGNARPFTGKYKGALVAVRNDGTYQALSAPSTFSGELEVKAQGIRATVDAAIINALDSQVNELWLYLMGGRLNAFYRFKVLTGAPWSGTQTIDATISEITAIAANLRMETDNVSPPDNIIGMEGPHYDRMLCLTAQILYPSRQRNPDSYSEGEAVRIGDATETALWIKKLNERVYVGTTRDIYFIDGDWTVLPDGSVNVVKRPLGVTSPPISSAVARGTVNGSDQLIYHSQDGWRVLGGTLLTDSSIDLLWRGFNRHGVSAVNTTNPAARFRAAISKNVLFAITPEGTDAGLSNVIHAYHFAKQRWYRFVYPQAFRSIYAEPDGTLLAGDNFGFVRQLDSANKQDDGAPIPVVLWTAADDNGEPFNYKNPQNFLLRMETGGVAARTAFHMNGSSSANTTVTTSQALTDTSVLDVSSSAEFNQIQFRVTGSFSVFALRGYEFGYLDNPKPLVVHDTGFIDLSNGELQWVRKIRVKAKSTVPLTVTPYFDGTPGTTTVVAVKGGKPYVYEVPLRREDKGRTVRVAVFSSLPSYVYWVQFEFNASGKQRQKTFSFEPDVAA